MDPNSIDDQGLHIGPTLEDLEEGIFAEQADPPVVPEPAPKKFAGKYDTAEELEKAYLESQKLIGKKAEKPTVEGAEPPAAEDAPKVETEEPKAEGDAPVLDFAKLSEEWNANEGTLTEETQAGLTKLGVTPEITGLFYAGIQSIISQRANDVQALAGTPEEYKSVVDWGIQNLDAGEQAVFNEALDKALYEGDTSAIKLMIPAVRAKMAGEGPSYVASRIDGNPGATKPFANQSEQNQAIQDRRYGRDAAYTREVETRIGASNF